jgi:hypothetical protein
MSAHPIWRASSIPAASHDTHGCVSDSLAEQKAGQMNDKLCSFILFVDLIYNIMEKHTNGKDTYQLMESTPCSFSSNGSC